MLQVRKIIIHTCKMMIKIKKDLKWITNFQKLINKQINHRYNNKYNNKCNNNNKKILNKYNKYNKYNRNNKKNLDSMMKMFLITQMNKIINI